MTGIGPALRRDPGTKGKAMNPQDFVTDLQGPLSQAYPIPVGGSDKLDRALLRLAKAGPDGVGKSSGAERPCGGQASPRR
jgi:hypothetical protein